MENKIIKDIENTEINEVEPIEQIEPQKPIYIYNYGIETKEYLFKEIASQDYEESKKQNKFVALVPAYATLLEPPEYGKNGIPVYSSELATESVTEIINEQIGTDEEGNPIFEEKEVTREVKKLIENWTIKPDYRTNFVKVDNDLNVYPITEIGNIEGFLVVDKIIGEEIKKEKDWFKIVDNEVIKKSEKEYKDEKAKEREEQFNKDFFNTSLGYIRRKVSMATGETKDFLSDLLPTISMGVQMGQPVQIIAYDKPDFTQEITDWTVLQNKQTVTANFVQECFMQLSNDFKPVNSEVVDENTIDTTQSDIQDELDTTTSKSDETDTDMLE